MEEVIYMVDSGPQVPAAGSFLVVTKHPEKENKSFDKEEQKWVFLLSPEPTQRHRPGWHVPGRHTCVWEDCAGLGAEGTTAGEPDTQGSVPLSRWVAGSAWWALRSHSISGLSACP